MSDRATQPQTNPFPTPKGGEAGLQRTLLSTDTTAQAGPKGVVAGWIAANSLIVAVLTIVAAFLEGEVGVLLPFFLVMLLLSLICTLPALLVRLLMPANASRTLMTTVGAIVSVPFSFLDFFGDSLLGQIGVIVLGAGAGFVWWWVEDLKSRPTPNETVSREIRS